MDYIDLSRYDEEDQPKAGPSPSGNYIDLSRYEYSESAPMQQPAAEESGGMLSDLWYSTLVGVNRLGQAGANLFGADDVAADYAALAEKRFSQLSEEFRRDMARSYVKELDDGSYGIGDFNLNTVLGTVTQSLPGMAAGFGVGGVATKGLTSLATRSPAVASTLAATGRVLPGAPTVGAGAGIAGAAIGEGAVEGAFAKQQVEDEILSLGAEELLQQSELAQAIYASMDPSIPQTERLMEMQRQLAEDLGTQASWQTGLTAAILGAPMGARFGRAVEGTGAVATPMRRIATNAVGEALEESSQSAVGQVLQNLAVSEADPTRELGDDVLNQAVGGAIAGAPFGVVSGAVESSYRQPEAGMPPQGGEPASQPAPEAVDQQEGADQVDEEGEELSPDDVISDEEFDALPPTVQQAFIAAANVDPIEASEAVRRNPGKAGTLRALADLKAVADGIGLPQRGDEEEEVQPAEQSAEPVDIPRAKQLNLKSRAAESRFVEKLKTDIDGAIAEYKKLPTTANGKILNTDEARKLSEDYNASPEARSELSAAVHEPASWLIKQIYARELKRPPVEGQDNVVLFTAGGTGSGKTTAVENVISEEVDRAKIIYDTNMNTFASADDKIRQALETGNRVKIAYVYRDPVEALVGGALPRAMNPKSSSYGRSVPLSEHAKTHVGSAQTILALAEKYGDNPNVEIQVLDNSRGKGKTALTTLDWLADQQYNGDVEARLMQALDQEYVSGKISKTVYRGFAGKDPDEAIQAAADRAAVGGVRQGDGGRYQQEPAEGLTDSDNAEGATNGVDEQAGIPDQRSAAPAEQRSLEAVQAADTEGAGQATGRQTAPVGQAGDGARLAPLQGQGADRVDNDRAAGRAGADVRANDDTIAGSRDDNRTSPATADSPREGTGAAQPARGGEQDQGAVDDRGPAAGGVAPEVQPRRPDRSPANGVADGRQTVRTNEEGAAEAPAAQAAQPVQGGGQAEGRVGEQADQDIAAPQSRDAVQNRNAGRTGEGVANEVDTGTGEFADDAARRAADGDATRTVAGRDGAGTGVAVPRETLADDGRGEAPRQDRADDRAVSLPGELEYAVTRAADGGQGFVGFGDRNQIVGFDGAEFPAGSVGVVAVYHRHPGRKAITKLQARAEKAGVRLMDVVVAGKSVGGIDRPADQEPGKLSIASMAGVKERFTGKGMPAAEVRGHIVDLAKKLRADVAVVQSEVDLPADALSVVHHFNGAGKTDGVYLGGKIYLIADNLTSAEEAVKTVLHEQVVHHGLRELMPGKKLEAVLTEIAESYGAIGLADIAANYGFNLSNPIERMQAAEEKLAVIAETMEDPNILVRAIAAVRAWLRDLGVIDGWTEGDIRSLLMASKRNLERGQTPAGTRYLDADRLMKREGYTLRDGYLRRRQADVVKQMEPLIGSKLGKIDDDRPLSQKVMDTIAFWRRIELADVKQGLIDSGASIEALERSVTGGSLLDAELSAYKAYGMTRNMHSVYAAAYLQGIPVYRNGWFSPDTSRKGFRDIFKGLVTHPDGDLTRAWELWAPAVRANRLIKEQNPDGTSREKLWTQKEIDQALQLEKRYPFFRDIMSDWQDFNNQLLDLAVDRGVLDPVTRVLWQTNDYVPFYRAMDEEDTAAGAGVSRQSPFSARGLSGQKVDSKRLSGSAEKIGPVVENMFMNTAHVLNSVFKNEAMQRIVDLGEGTVLERIPSKAMPTRFTPEQLATAMERAGVLPAGQGKAIVAAMSQQQRESWVTLFRMTAPKGADVVSMYQGGKPTYFRVKDPMLLRAITAMGHNSLNSLLKIFAGAKNLLTMAVTADPAFAIRNFARDTLSVFVTAPEVPMTPVIDSIKGFYKALRGDPVLMKIFAAGGYGGGFYDTNPDDVRKLIAQKVPKNKLDAFMSTIVSPRRWWQVWLKIGNAAEMANRVAVYDAMKRKGVSDAEAAYMSMDIMNFSMRGDWPSTFVATSTLPFLNARIQGLYRLYRGARDNRGAFMARGMMLVGITAALWAINSDDERYQELEEWDKDTYWHFWIGDDHYRFPKPFEVGAIFGTIPERLMSALKGTESWSLMGERMAHMIKDTFAMNPVPQLVAPIVEQYANKDAFTGRPIVGMDLQRLLPEAQFDWRTSQTMRLLASAMPDALPEWLRSPKRLEAMYNGYTGTLGGYILSVVDGAARAAVDAPERPAMTLSDVPGIKSFYRGDEPRSVKYLTEFYEMMNEADKVAATLKRMQADGADVTAFVEENRKALGARKALSDVGEALSDLNKQAKAIAANRMLTAEKKREMLDAIQVKKNELAKRGASISLE